MMARVKKLLPASRPAWPLILLMMAACLVISVTLLLGQSLRLDEAQSLFQTARTIPGMLMLVGQDVHVPLYHFILHFWTVAFGNDVAVGRIPSLICFLAIIPITYLLGKENFNRRIGLTAALFVTLSPFMNWYGSEARMYTLLTLMTVLNQLFFMRAWRTGKSSSWLFYGLTAILGAYSHYFFLFVLATQGVFYLTHRTSFKRGSFARLAVAAVAVVAALAPWLLYVVSLGSASGTKPLLVKPTTVDLFNTFSQFLFGFQTDRLNTIIVSLWPLVVLLAFLTLQRKKRMETHVVYFALAAVLPVVFAFVFSLTVRPFFLSRYLIVSLPALFLFIAWVIDNYSTKLRIIIGTILVLGMGASLFVEINSPVTPVKENYQGAVRYLEQNVTPQDTILISAPFTIYPIDYYYDGPANLQTLPLWDRFKSGSAPSYDSATFPAQVKTATGDKQYAYLILSYDQGYEEDVRQYFANRYELISKREFSDDLTVYKYKIRYDPVVELKPTTDPIQAPVNAPVAP